MNLQIARSSLPHCPVALCVLAACICAASGCDELKQPRDDGSASEASSETTVERASEERTWPKMHTIAHGDTFFSIAREYYGDGTKWELIAEANAGLHATGLLVGERLTVPAPR